MYDSRLQSSLSPCPVSVLCVRAVCVCAHIQEAAMVVPPLRRSRICWQSCRDRRSPTRSRVRLASASRRARCPGGVSRGIGRWRQASRMAWALSLSPRTHSPSDSSREEEEIKKKNAWVASARYAYLCVFTCVWIQGHGRPRRLLSSFFIICHYELKSITTSRRTVQKIRLCLSYRLYRRCESCVGGCAPAAGVSLWDWLQPSASLWSREETPKTNKTKQKHQITNFVIKYLQVSFSEKHWCPHVISSRTQYNTWNIYCIYTRHTPPSVEPVMQSTS